MTLYASGRQTVGLGSIVRRVCYACCVGSNTGYCKKIYRTL